MAVLSGWPYNYVIINAGWECVLFTWQICDMYENVLQGNSTFCSHALFVYSVE